MLHVKGLNALYGSQPVLFDLGFEVKQGEAVALLGRNGMGKTATLKSILGLITARAETLSLLNKPLQPLPAYRRPQLGIGYTSQEGRVFPELSVLDNLKLGGGRDLQKLDELLAYFPQLKTRLKQPAGTLSGGEQQMLTLVRALWCEPRLLLLDEPSEGLMPALVEQLERVLKAFCDRGGSVLLAEQHVSWIQSWVDRVCILERGRLVFHGEAAALTPEIMRRYLGAL